MHRGWIGDTLSDKNVAVAVLSGFGTGDGSEWYDDECGILDHVRLGWDPNDLRDCLSCIFYFDLKREASTCAR